MDYVAFLVQIKPCKELSPNKNYISNNMEKYTFNLGENKKILKNLIYKFYLSKIKGQNYTK